MGLFNKLVSGVVSKVLENIDPAAIPALATQYIGETELGSVGGLLARLREAGFGAEVDSWLGTGPNLPLTAEQLRGGLGDRALAQFAEATGLSADKLLSLMAQYLPQTIDRMSPNGQIEEAPPQGPDDTAAG
jgi:uncharacterized protein YidB (DUF937 family)